MAFNKYIILKPEELNLSYTCSGDIVSDSTKYLYALLDLPDKYISLNQAVTFKGGNQIYTVIPDNNFIVQVPHEVIKAPGFYVSIEFSDGKGFRAVSYTHLPVIP